MSVKSLGYLTGSVAASAPSYPVAARDLSAHRVVILTNSGVDYPSLAVIEHGDAALGVTTGAVASGSMAPYLYEGRMSDPSWNWTVGPLFVGDMGVIVSAPPSGAWLRQIGEAVGPNVIVLNLFPTYYRGT